MEKNSIKKYAVWARQELIARVSQRAEQYGITEQEIIDERAENIHGVVLTPAQIEQRQALIRLIRRDGYRQAMEEVAYIWFNRFMALRFMEVNDYLPGHTRAFTDDQNAFKPRILSDALDLELNGLDIDRVIAMKEANDTEKLYQYLLIMLCNHLSGILPGMFQRINDYTELLFPEHLLREGSVLQQLIAMIPQEDWLAAEVPEGSFSCATTDVGRIENSAASPAVQIIGWLYQYYNAELKDQVFANLKKNIKISKENIPAATQLFTPHWIVRYMVENSLGRLWMEGHPDEDLKASWQYYLEEAEQEPEVQAQLQTVRAEYARMKPEEILCIDPCCGSGHILVYLFDVLVQIYTAYGYPTREAVASIVRNNLWGLDIDDRAAQLAYFAVMMKARQYDKGWFRRGIEPNVFALQDSPEIKEDAYALFGDHADAARRVVFAFRDAKEYGSIIQPNVTEEELDQLNAVLFQQDEMADYGSLATQVAVDNMVNIFAILIKQTRALVQKYHVVVTNPPYMGSRKSMNQVLKKYVERKYPDSKSDLYTVFIERNIALANSNSFVGMLTQQSFMFTDDYKELREKLQRNVSIVNMAHLGSDAFEDIGGEVVQTTAFVLQTSINNPYMRGTYSRLIDYDCVDKPKNLKNKKNIFGSSWIDLRDIKAMPISYWLSPAMRLCFDKGTPFEQYGNPRAGITTGDNDRFMRFWFEVDYNKIGFHYHSVADFHKSCSLYIPYNKGGRQIRWYGNNDYVLMFDSVNYSILENQGNHLPSKQYYCQKCITWSDISGRSFAARFCDYGTVFDVKGSCGFPNDDNFWLSMAVLNSKLTPKFIDALNPTTTTQVGDLKRIPVVPPTKAEHEEIDSLVVKCIEITKRIYDSYEDSWGFSKHPLVQRLNSVQLAYEKWEHITTQAFDAIKHYETMINSILVRCYGLEAEISCEVDKADITLRKATLGDDIRSLISYAVGCMFGRYSLDAPGLIFAGGSFDDKYVTAEEPWMTGDGDVMTTQRGNTLAFRVKYGALKHNGKIINLSFLPDGSGVLPITDDEYFQDDIVNRFVKFIETVFGPNELEDNLKFIASALYPNGGGTARDLIRQYFLNDFYKDHLKVYQKRPIYWLFDAGKKNSFKCLIYLHRYRPDTVARVRTDYVHEMQARYRTAMEELTRRVDSTSGSERVRLQKQLQKVQAQDQELRKYEEKIHHYADMMLPLDLDDGVKVNYAKLQDVLSPIK